VHIVIDTRPSSELSDVEVVAYLFKSLRANGFQKVEQVRKDLASKFPDMPEERQRRCLGRLARVMS
jgi:hypothetical protein